MTAKPASITAPAMTGPLAACFLACAGALALAGEVRAETRPVPVPDSTLASAGALQFDIPAQDLGGALNAYSRLTGLAVLIDSAHARRQAGDVRGAFTPGEALRQLLAGTGLQGRRADAQSIVISPAPDVPPPPAAPAAAAGVLDIPGVSGAAPGVLPYIAKVQQALRDALCATRRTRPGSYRLALQMRLDPRGGVERFRLLDTTGEAARDAAISAVVKGLAVGEAPPAAMPQPVSILLVPDSPSAPTRCPSAAEVHGVPDVSPASCAVHASCDRPAAGRHVHA